MMTQTEEAEDLVIRDSSSNCCIKILGGMREFGRNMLLIETQTDALIIDCGIKIQDNSDPVLPYMENIELAKDKIRGLFLTHGHEDHIGAVPYLVSFFPEIQIYGSRETLCFLETRHQITGKRFMPEEWFSFSTIKIAGFNVDHSIPGAVGFVIDTPQGRIVVSGDFCINDLNDTGTSGMTDSIKKLLPEGVDLLITESVNASAPARSLNEDLINNEIFRIFNIEKGRVFATLFSSHISRIKSFLKAAQATGRKVYAAGNAVKTTLEIAHNIDPVSFPRKVYPEFNNSLKEKDCLVLLSGSQGDMDSSFNKLKDNPKFPEDTDCIIVSARIIPGNCRRMTSLLNRISEKTRRIYISPAYPVHTSGHASWKELEFLFKRISPSNIIPMHSEIITALNVETIASKAGLNKTNVLFPYNMQGIVLKNGEVSLEKWKETQTFLSEMSEEKTILSKNGIAFVILPRRGDEIGRVSITIRGFFPVDEYQDFIKDVCDTLEGEAQNAIYEGLKSVKDLSRLLQIETRRLFRKKFRKSPWIIARIIDMGKT